MPSTHAQQQPTEAVVSNGRPQVFFLVDDPIMDGLYRSMLSAKDCVLVWCESGKRWHESLSSFSYDLVVIDISLFGDKPVEALHQVKLLAPDASVVVLSDNQDAALAITAFRMGIADYLLKPVSPETLGWAIEKALSQRRLRSSNQGLNADLSVFEAAHHISISDTEEQMRTLAMKHLVRMLSAQNACWVWPKADKGLKMEALKHQDGRELQSFKEFLTAHADLRQSLFLNGLTSKPEAWIRESHAWIPLNGDWKGGIYLYGITCTIDTALVARVEFLIRNLEISLENFRRYIEAKKMTYVDDLTGLYNVRYLEIAVNSAVERMKSPETGFCLLFIDIDRFKHVNDNHGHLIGSQMIVQLGRLLKKSLREIDLLFRYGGDEFIVLISEVSLATGVQTAERLRKEVERRVFRFDELRLQVTLSIGVARFPDHATDGATLIRLADEAMYQSKKTGRNSVFSATTGECITETATSK